MNIGEVLSRARQIIWQHKILWIFGILAACSSTNPYTPNYRAEYQHDLSPQFNYYFGQLTGWEIALIVLIVLLVVLILIALVIFLGTMGRVGMIRGTLQADEGAARLSFGEIFSGSLPYFWRVFGLNLVVGLAFAAIVILITISFAITVIGLVCLIPFFCLLAPIGWFVSLIIEQANNAIVIENKSLLDGLQHGWQVVRANFGNILVMGLILLVIGMIGGFLIGLPVVAVIWPAVAGLIIGTQRATQAGLVLAGLCLVGYIPVAILLNGILQGYIRSAWTLTYLRLTRGQASSVVEAPVVS